MIQAAKAQGNVYFVYHSVLHSVLQDMPHHKKKLAVEQMLVDSGLTYTIIQPAVFMQMLMPAVKSVRNGGPLVQKFFLTDDTRMNLLHLEDLGEAVGAIFSSREYENGTYELCGKENFSLEGGADRKLDSEKGVNEMYTKEQEEIALREYERLESVHAVIQRLGYPSKSTLYRWYERKKAGGENKHGSISDYPVDIGHCCNTPGHPRHPPAELKYDAIHRCFEMGEDIEYVSREIGYSRASIYAWRRKYLKHGMVGLMAKKKSIPRQPLLSETPAPQSEELETLRAKLQELQLEVDVLKETIEVIKKTQAPI